MRTKRLVIFIGLFVALAGCAPGPDSPMGFSLPPGDPAVGQEVFVAQACTACHTIHELDMPSPEAAGPVTVTIGGPVTMVKTYADLLTSIINPSHRLAPGYPIDEVSTDGTSLMPNYNDVLTVTELVDLVTFLQPQYDTIQIPPMYYRGYQYQ